MAEKKHVFSFEEAKGKGKELLGGKGANLGEMTQIKIPVPQGFAIITSGYLHFLAPGVSVKI